LLLLVIAFLAISVAVVIRSLRTRPEATDTSSTTVTSGTAGTESDVRDTSGTTVTSGTTITQTVASDTSTTTRHDPPPPTPPRGSIGIAGVGGLPRGDVFQALKSSISAARRERSAITGRLDRKCRPDLVFPDVTVCDDTLDLTIRDLRTGQTDSVTLTGEGAGSTGGDAARDARSKLIAKIREHFSGEDRP
jgi:hypothetical protein